MELTRYEQEIIINYNQEDKTATCFTCDRALIRRLYELCQKSSEITVTKEGDDSKTYSFPKKWVKVKMPRQLSDEKRAELKLRAINNFGGGKSGQA